MDPHTHHAVAVGGPSRQHPHAPAVLVDIEAGDFVTALSDAITSTAWPRFGWPASLPIARLPDQAAPRALFQPIHRRFNLVLFDTHCEVFGSPRLDPRKIESSGFVVRRWAGPDDINAQALADPHNWQTWQAEGWRGLPNAAAFDADPDPARRPAPRTGNPGVDARLAALRAVHPAEAVNPLHALMPAVCDAAKRSLLYGVVPTSEALRKPTDTAVDYAAARTPGSTARDSFVAHLSPYLSRANIRPLPGARSSFDATWLNGSDPVDASEPDSGDSSAMREQFAAFIRQLAFEFDINGRGKALLPLLEELRLGRNETTLGLATRITTGASAFLQACVRVATDVNAGSVYIPDDFGPVPAGWLDRFTNTALIVLEGRAAEARTLEGRFDDAEALYAIRAFVRVRGEPGYPNRLVWSDMTPLYRVAPWFASTGTPQARIALPAFDRASLAAMKPNVAFDVPPALANLLMRNKPEDFMKKPKAGSDIGLGWLCSFSIPIITICAFILLNVVLSLLNLVFFWLPFVKICLPVPRKK
ncbi:hypothetical protein ACS5PN_03415 [Roseateles sp. NT4]|uniref:hypothetical protein n=1 Tax=Roseateles sp. NT4 TaxID=3453715 RepID=UPI003EEF7837